MPSMHRPHREASAPTPPRNGSAGWTDLARLVVPERMVRLASTDKESAIGELLDCVGRTAPLSAEDLRTLTTSVLERERDLNTQLAPGWAVPHGRLATLAQPLLVVGRSAKGLAYGPPGLGRVHLVFLFVSSLGTHATYLRALSALARALGDDVGRARAAARATTPDQFLAALGPVPPDLKRIAPSRRLPHAVRALVRHVLYLADELDAGGIVVFADTLRAPELLHTVVTQRTVLATRAGALPATIVNKARGVVSLPRGRFSVETAIQLALVSAGARGMLGEGKVIAVCGERERDDLDTVRIERPEMFFARIYGASGDGVTAEVVERALQLAVELGDEGREGRALGTTFVLGDTVNVRRFTRQLTINPFRGYDEHERNLLDPTLDQTIKELALLDGAFVIDARGIIQSAGTYLSPPSEDIDLASGLGTRHRAAAGLTRETKAIAIVLSQSGGRVSVFRGGVEVMHLSPPRVRPGAVAAD
jgi:DNA integrity scanning protein DisA with diadenylate cyclase activity/mannitol/fructose-specific phosphotransferase system IIA component (Ntr-type)